MHPKSNQSEHESQLACTRWPFTPQCHRCCVQKQQSCMCTMETRKTICMCQRNSTACRRVSETLTNSQPSSSSVSELSPAAGRCAGTAGIIIPEVLGGNKSAISETSGSIVGSMAGLHVHTSCHHTWRGDTSATGGRCQIGSKAAVGILIPRRDSINE